MIQSLMHTLRTDRPKLAPVRVWRAYAMLDEYKGAQPANELTALVALIAASAVWMQRSRPMARL